MRSHFAKAQQGYEKALTLSRQASTRALTAQALNNLGYLISEENNLGPLNQDENRNADAHKNDEKARPSTASWRRARQRLTGQAFNKSRSVFTSWIP